MKPPTFEELLKRYTRALQCAAASPASEREAKELEHIIVARFLAFAHAGGYAAIIRAWKAVPAGSEIEDTLWQLANILRGAAVPATGEEIS